VLLLGKEASESGLTLRLSQAPSGHRWAGVHLACHGLIDPTDPARSALALSAGGSSDGLLTALEILRLRIPTDLVVLSACDTAGDQYVGGEGLQGLVRAFMFAGSPRVVAGLWKVDDAATRALMDAFYDAWKAGKSAAESLRTAQAAVRTQERWRHPAYWAPWVLWGLPD
jgi:CHAT domain-containing protein